MNYKEIFTKIYLDEKGEIKKKTKNAIIIMIGGLLLVLVSVFLPGKGLVTPAIGIIGATTYAIYKNNKFKKDLQKNAGDTIKRFDDFEKFT